MLPATLTIGQGRRVTPATAQVLLETRSVHARAGMTQTAKNLLIIPDVLTALSTLGRPLGLAAASRPTTARLKISLSITRTSCENHAGPHGQVNRLTRAARVQTCPRPRQVSPHRRRRDAQLPRRLTLRATCGRPS